MLYLPEDVKNLWSPENVCKFCVIVSSLPFYTLCIIRISLSKFLSVIKARLMFFFVEINLDRPRDRKRTRPCRRNQAGTDILLLFIGKKLRMIVWGINLQYALQSVTLGCKPTGTITTGKSPMFVRSQHSVFWYLTTINVVTVFIPYF